MDLLALPIGILFFVVAIWGSMRVVREVTVAADISAQKRTVALVLLMAAVIELVAPIAVLHGQKVDGWSLIFSLMFGWFTVALVLGVSFQIAYRAKKKEAYRAAVSAILMTPGILLLGWFMVGRYLLGAFQVVTSS